VNPRNQENPKLPLPRLPDDDRQLAEWAKEYEAWAEEQDRLDRTFHEDHD
jgi:hypothetical protein